MTEIRCIATDLDFTQLHFKSPIQDGFFDIMRRRGWGDDDIYPVWQHAETQGFSLEKFFAAAKSLAPELLIGDRESIRDEFDRWLERSVEPYPDSAPFLKKWWGVVPIAIVTAGDRFYQRRKVALSRIPYDELYVVPPRHRKVNVLSYLIGRHRSPVLFIEDRSDELDAAYFEFGAENVVTVLILRPDSPYDGIQPRYNHVKVRSLEEVNALIG